MRNTCLILVLVFSLFEYSKLEGQEENGVFAFANLETGSKFAPELVYNYKFEVAQKVFKDLVEARGDYRTIPPKFFMNKGRQFIALVKQNSGEVFLEEKAYDVCRTFGADSLNALAALIGHEIIHYYEHHDWNRAFINRNPNSPLSEKLKEMEEGIKYEAEADYYGGILAITAGYNPYVIFEDFIGAAYHSYGLPEQIEGYPSLGERKKLYQTTADRLRSFHSIYQTANLLALTGFNDIANDYYKMILREYTSYEVYNNFGANATLAALNLYEPKEMPFVLPVELDLKSRLDALITRVPDDVLIKRKMLLEDAENWLGRASQLNKKEPSPNINLAIVQLLKGDREKAREMANEAILLGEAQNLTKAIADANIVLGVIAALEDDNEQANTLFETAKTGNEILASINLGRLETDYQPDKLMATPPRGIETIEDVKLENFLSELGTMESITVSDMILCGKKSMDQSELFLHYGYDGDEIILFHRTKPDYWATTKLGIKLGDNIEQIKEAYGLPIQTLNLPKGTCLVYPNHKILFLLDEFGQLREWSIYLIRQEP